MPLLRCFLSAVLIFLLNGAMGAGEAAAQDFTKKVLLLNSYHPGYLWSDGLQGGIIDTFQKMNPGWLPHIEYLDCKRFPEGQHLEYLSSLLQFKYQGLSLVVAMDNPALEFVLKNRKKLFENTPILFCGINDFTPEMIQGHPNVTGRAENNDIGGTLDIMLKLHPDAREILVIHDFTTTGLALRKATENVIPRFSAHTRFRFLDRLDLDDVLKELKSLSKGSLVLDLGLITDKTGRIFGVAEITALLAKHSRVPIYGAFESMLGQGIVGGKLISPGIHGARTGNMALRILDGERPSHMAVETQSDARFMFDHAAMTRFSIPISALPEDSLLINRPVSLYALHRSVIHLSLLAIAVLCAIIALLGANIAQRKKAIGALRMSEERFRLGFENANEGVCLIDEEGRLMRVNKRMCDILGYQRKELEGAKVTDFALGEGMDQSQAFLKQGISGELENSVFEERYFHKDGHLIYTRVSSSAVRDPKGEILYFISHVQDITERKRAEEALRKSEETYRTLFENMTQGAFRQRADGAFVDVNPAALKMFGLRREEFLSRTSENPNWEVSYENGTLVSGTDHPWMAALKSGKPVSGLTVGVRNELMGEMIWMEINAIPEFHPGSSSPYQVVVTMHDITKRKTAEDELKRSEERFRYLIENAPDAIFVRTEGCFSYVNPAMVRLLGFSSADQLIGQRVLDRIHPDGRAMAAERMKSIMIASEPLPMKVQKYLRMDGTPVDVEASPVRLSYGGRKGALVFLRDITERKRAGEEQARMHSLLQQAQKMEAIGTLAGGIAHDFNNLLSVIIGNAELAMPEIAGASPALYSLDQIVKAGYRARDLVGQILAFSRMSERERKPIRIGSIAKEVLKFLRASLPSTIEIRRSIDTSQDTVLADPTQIHQVLMNLCTNASHAMGDEGGVLELVMTTIDLASEQPGPHPDLRPGPYLKLSVIDTGCGMSPQVMKRIFDPYFTTKEKGTGTGLGLAVVHGIVKDLGGDIHVQSEPGQGSRFDVLFPLADEKVISGIKSYGEEPPRGHERILFVDDEEGVVDLGKRMLQHLGYAVEIRTSSVEALEAFKAQPDIYDLVITDMTMPKMTGDRLAGELMAIRPETPIIICTGHSERISDERARSIGISAYIMKPIDMHEMAGTIRKVLDKPGKH